MCPDAVSIIHWAIPGHYLCHLFGCGHRCSDHCRRRYVVGYRRLWVAILMSLMVGAENGPGLGHKCGNGCPTTDMSTVPNALNDSGVLSTPEPNGM